MLNLRFTDRERANRVTVLHRERTFRGHLTTKFLTQLRSFHSVYLRIFLRLSPKS